MVRHVAWMLWGTLFMLFSVIKGMMRLFYFEIIECYNFILFFLVERKFIELERGEQAWSPYYKYESTMGRLEVKPSFP